MERKPEITYPCPWSYVVVGTGENQLLLHIEVALAGETFERVTSRHSSSGKYASIEVTLIVRDEAHRLGVFRALQDSPLVKLVI
ncbi:MAG: DUF493 domain-containing protein [Planctomycetota bacterium]|nr:DUF493 domain-containing protein [Planctomycetota bacterium]